MSHHLAATAANALSGSLIKARCGGNPAGDGGKCSMDRLILAIRPQISPFGPNLFNTFHTLKVVMGPEGWPEGPWRYDERQRLAGLSPAPLPQRAWAAAGEILPLPCYN